MADVTQDPFEYTRDEIAALNALVSTPIKDLQPTATYVNLLATAKFLIGEYDAAEKAYHLLATAKTDLPYKNLHFNESSCRQLESAEDEVILGYLPSVRDIRPFEKVANNIFLLPSDIKYFKKFSIPLTRSIWDLAPSVAIHFHVVANTPADDDTLNHFTENFKSANVRVTSKPLPSLTSTQSENGARCYYHTIRLIRFYQFLRDNLQTLWMLDVDALANQDPTKMFALLADNDIGIRTRPGRLEPWNQFSACLLTAQPTPAALSYTRLVAAYLSHFLSGDGLSWRTDQVALFSAYHHMRSQNQAPRIQSWGPDITDVGTYRPESTIWFTAGANKFRLNTNPQDVGFTEQEARYIEKYRRYQKQEAAKTE